MMHAHPSLPNSMHVYTYKLVCVYVTCKLVHMYIYMYMFMCSYVCTYVTRGFGISCVCVGQKFFFRVRYSKTLLLTIDTYC